MKKKNNIYFVVSDIHGFLTPLLGALEAAGFDSDNDNHILIINGDVFDRGDETIKLYKWLNSFPEHRIVYIKGNHEYLLEDCLKRRAFHSYDYRNGTYHTLLQIFLYENAKWDLPVPLNDEQLFNHMDSSKVINWFKTRNWVNYFELPSCIITHSFIPLHNLDGKHYSEINNRVYNYNPCWRNNTTAREWLEASWGCPYLKFFSGYFNEEIKNNKTLIVGHWQTPHFAKYIQDKELCDINQLKESYNNDGIFYCENLMGIDSTVLRSNKINVVVIKNNKFLSSVKGKEIIPIKIKNFNVKDYDDIFKNISD